MKIISNCPICETHNLHVIDDNNTKLMQCLTCGYATSDKFKYEDKKSTNEAYNSLSDEMKNWSKEQDNRVWIPGMLTLPEGMIYPVDNDGIMNWGYSKMIDIPKEEQKKYVNPDGGFYEKMYDSNGTKIFETFGECFAEIRKNMLKKPKENKNIKLPKLKKINA